MPMKLDIRPGSELGGVAVLLWKRAQWRYREAVLWDVPMRSRFALFPQAIAKAWLCGIFWLDGEPAGLSWLYPLSLGASACNIHFMFARQLPEARPAAVEFLKALAGRKIGPLLCLIPRPFHHARNFAKALGFTSLQSIPDSCNVAGSGLHAGDLLYLNMAASLPAEPRPPALPAPLPPACSHMGIRVHE